ncbi:inhibitor of the pro-sigma K processing machinery [Gracilibacillus halotolerans]|uniref:Inhibitor of the pro-sigma K processing machinery n=2 Tax=Gracilibacillus halotolerans TaxID=74386 RepID=A0A841RGZ3_9BACI|nr:inhibitor of the pro-sigma K processing machinery [Gracilibacillus halotolerans]
MMNVWIILGVLGAIVLLFIKGIPLQFVRWTGKLFIRVTIGVLCLFFLNIFGAQLGLHIPINAFTALVAGFLGLPGLASLTAIHVFIF